MVFDEELIRSPFSLHREQFRLRLAPTLGIEAPFRESLFAAVFRPRTNFWRPFILYGGIRRTSLRTLPARCACVTPP